MTNVAKNVRIMVRNKIGIRITVKFSIPQGLFVHVIPHEQIDNNVSVAVLGQKHE